MKKDCDIFEVWEEYKNGLYRFILKRIGDEDDAKDILQDVLLKSYQFCAKGREVLYLKAWLFKIAQNAVADYYKKKPQHEGYPAELIGEETAASMVGEASAYIMALLKLLPVEYAEPLRMYDLEDINQKEIAQQLKISLVNAKSRIQRARVKLKERFLECCVVEFGDNGEMISFDIKPQCSELVAEKNRLEKIT